MTTGIQLAPGTIFARDYRVDRLLRQGGMGAVYAVTQVSTNTPRALKLMLPSLLGDTAARQRFTQEAKVGADVQSDHVVHVIAAGVDEDTGAPWLAMELLEGEELGERVARLGPMDRTTARDLFSQLRHALGAAHRSAIVHRDLKPENVFLATSRRSGAVAFDAKVLDFGIAKLTSEARSANTGAMGTPLWMAPEQTEGGRQIAPATDTWAIGLIAYFVLTGRSFWRAASNEDASLPMVFREILFDPIPAASERAAEQGVATLLPFFFDEWFGRCVCRDLSTRFSNADAAIEPFLDMLADQPSTGRTSATSPGANVPALSSTGRPAESEASDERQPNSRSRRVAAFAAIALAAVAVAGLAGWTRRPSPTEAPRAVPSATQVPLWTDVVLAEGILPNEPVDQAATTVVISSKALSIGPPLLRLFGLPGDKSLGAPAEYKRSGPTDLLIVPLAEAAKGLSGTRALVVMDRETPYRLLVDVAFTLGQSSYQRLDLAFMRQGELRTITTYGPTAKTMRDTDRRSAVVLFGTTDVRVSTASLVNGDASKAESVFYGPGCTPADGGTMTFSRNGFDVGALRSCLLRVRAATDARLDAAFAGDVKATFAEILPVLQVMREVFGEVSLAIARW